jgi:predicted HNH restriction endonuclease
VHHLTYIRVFQELPSDLVALCKPCHAEIHWQQPANDNQLQFSFDFSENEEEDDNVKALP